MLTSGNVYEEGGGNVSSSSRIDHGLSPGEDIASGTGWSDGRRIKFNNEGEMGTKKAGEERVEIRWGQRELIL